MAAALREPMASLPILRDEIHSMSFRHSLHRNLTGGVLRYGAVGIKIGLDGNNEQGTIEKLTGLHNSSGCLKSKSSLKGSLLCDGLDNSSIPLSIGPHLELILRPFVELGLW
jgi:hypothetical protein